MADEDLSAAPAELENPANPTEQETVEEPAEAQIDPDTGEPIEADDLEDIEVDGKAYRVPKELKGAFMRNADYTQGKQSTAETKRALEAREAEIEERTKATDAELDARAELVGVSKNLAHYAAFTQAQWDDAYAADYVATDRHYRMFQSLKDQKAELEGKVGKAAAERTEKAQSSETKRIQETLAHAAKNNIKPERVGELVRFAAEIIGVPDSVLRNNWSPQLLDLLHFASIGKASLKKASAAKTPVVPAEPLTIVKPRNSPPPAGLSDKLSTEEWVRRRDAQVRNRA